MTENRHPDGPRGEQSSGPQCSPVQDMRGLTELVGQLANGILHHHGSPPDMTRAVIRAAIDALIDPYDAPRPDSESPGLSGPLVPEFSAIRLLLRIALINDGVGSPDLADARTRARVRAAAERELEEALGGSTPIPLGEEEYDLEAMHDDPLFDELRKVSPMFREYQRQLQDRGKVGRVFSLTELWKAAGGPWGQSPRHYAHCVRETMSARIEDLGGPGGDVLADEQTAFHYCTIIDDRIMTAVMTRWFQKRRNWIAFELTDAVDNPDPFIGLFSMLAANEQDLAADQSRRRPIDAAKEKAAPMDHYAGETCVAQLCRTVDAWRIDRADPSSGTLDPEAS